MYFEYSIKPNHLFPYIYNIKNYFLSTSECLDKSTFIGYKLGEHGGNFIEFNDDFINFSYYKDYKLKKNDEVFLTNLDIDGEEIESDIIKFYYQSNNHEYFKYEIFSESNSIEVENSVKKILIENILKLQQTNTRIAYTAGLDSSTTAYLAHQIKLDFTAVIFIGINLGNLPFKKIEYYKCENRPSFDIAFGPLENIKFGFYQQENNNLITGYYGDLAMLHHGQMFFQSQHLSNVTVTNLYDQTKYDDRYGIFNNKDELIKNAIWLNKQNYFRHWFTNFQILDPYRDPRLFTTILSLNIDDLILQLGTGFIQKNIIEKIDPTYLKNLCEYKNNYAKFK